MVRIVSATGMADRASVQCCFRAAAVTAHIHQCKDVCTLASSLHVVPCTGTIAMCAVVPHLVLVLGALGQAQW